MRHPRTSPCRQAVQAAVQAAQAAPAVQAETVSVPSVEASAQAAVHQAASPAPSSDLGTAGQFAASCSCGGGDAPWVY